MRLIAALIIISIGMAAWFTCAMWEKHQLDLAGAQLVQADLQICMQVPPPAPIMPVVRQRRPALNPHMKDVA